MTTAPSPEPAHAELVVVRHGESIGNANGWFAGWRDVELTVRGREQAVVAGRRLRALGVTFAAAFTSELRRATDTVDLMLQELDHAPPRVGCWRLNERHYGALQGQAKETSKRLHGSARIRTFRTSWDQAPPAAAAGSIDDPRTDPRYAAIRASLPLTESLGDLVARTAPVWDELRTWLHSGQSLLVVAHNLSLRALVRPLEGITEPRLPDWEFGNATPRRYRLDRQLRPITIETLQP